MTLLLFSTEFDSFPDCRKLVNVLGLTPFELVPTRATNVIRVRAQRQAWLQADDLQRA